jgi:protein tyrosine phosphatase (PTP) superfamily phosphohydrolase (DUF442 family)
VPDRLTPVRSARFLTAAFGVLLAAPAFSQGAAPDLGRAQGEAARILAAGPQKDARGVRGTPDADSVETPTEPLGNFHLVSPGFYRSAQPSNEGYAQLRDLGVKTILTLKSNGDQEKRDAGAYGLAVENVPMSGFAAPTFEQMDQALDIIATARRPLLVHCQYGKDRTGFVVASYRVTVEKKDVDASVQEAYDYGCCFAPFGDLKGFLESYRRHRRALRRSTPARQ